PALLLAFALVAGAQQTDYKVGATFVPRPIDRVLERVDAEKDQWIGERDFEALNVKLKEISKKIIEGKGEFPTLSREIERFQSLTLVELKIVSSNRASEGSPFADIAIRVEMGGRTPDG